MSNIVATNRMTATELINANGKIDFIKNPKTGKLFFTCGSITGYVSPAVEQNVQSVTKEDLQFAEVSIDGGQAIPTLMMKGAANVVKSLQ